MADGVTEGHMINGIPTPSGDLNNTMSGEFGGFNTAINSYRNKAYTATCVGMGAEDEDRCGQFRQLDGDDSLLPRPHGLILQDRCYLERPILHKNQQHRADAQVQGSARKGVRR